MSALGGPVVIIQVGALPPPLGGVTIHCQRVLEALRGLGYEVDLINPRRLKVSNSGEVLGTEALRLLARARAARSPVFLHYSSSSCPKRSLKLWLTSKLVAPDRLVLVQHSGSFPRDLETRSLATILQRRVLRRAAAMLCLSTAIQEALRKVSPKTIAIRASSFLPDETIRSVAAEPIPVTSSPVLVTSGYRTPIYRYEEVIDAWQVLRRDFPQLELHCYCYGDTDVEYWNVITRRLDSQPAIRVFQETGPAAFLRALRSASVYLRNTSHDSYGVAVAESLFLGTPVVATSVCDRPAGAALFEVGDVEALTQQARLALAEDHVVGTSSWGGDGVQGYLKALDLFSSHPG